MHSPKNTPPPKDEIIYSISAKEYAQMSAEERAMWSPVKAKYEKIPLFCKISFLIAALCAIIYAVICASERFADFFNNNISSGFRLVLAKITNALPFSLAKAFICYKQLFVQLRKAVGHLGKAVLSISDLDR